MADMHLTYWKVVVGAYSFVERQQQIQLHAVA
jgi:hypothetical protein